MEENTRRRLAGHLQSRIHEMLPGYYFDAEEVDNILEEFLKIEATPDIGHVREELLRILSPWETPEDKDDLNNLSTRQLHDKWLKMCEWKVE